MVVVAEIVDFTRGDDDDDYDDDDDDDDDDDYDDEDNDSCVIEGNVSQRPSNTSNMHIAYLFLSLQLLSFKVLCFAFCVVYSITDRLR